MRYFLIILGVVALTGCNERRDQTAANAIAGVDALVSVAQPGAEAVAGEVAAGTKANIAATAGTKQAELPAPEQTAEQIIEDPASYREKAEEDERRATAGFWKAALGWGAAGLTAVLGVLKFVPGAHQPIVGVVQRLLESKKDASWRKREEGLASGARTMIEVIEALDSEGKIKEAVARKLGPDGKVAVDAVINSLENGKAKV